MVTNKKTNTWSKVWLVASKMGLVVSLSFLMSACGDSGQDSVKAGTPQSDNNGCISNNGYGCQYSHMPQGWQPYPRDQYGYYQNPQNPQYPQNPQQPYNPHQPQNPQNGGVTACGGGMYPVNHPQYGMACMPVQNPNQYYQQPWGNYGAYMVYCNTLQPNSCPQGRMCVPIYQTMPQPSPYSQAWNTGTYVSWGVCR